MGSLLQDIRHAARALRRAPGFTLVAVLTLALGIGANSTLFSIVRAALLQPLPFDDPARIVSVGVSQEGRPDGGAAVHEFYLEWKDQARTLSQVAAYSTRSANLSGEGEPERIPGARITASLWPLLGVRPALGRGFTQDDERGTAPTVILSDALWQRRFKADRAIIGRSITLDGMPVTVAGVAPAGFDYPGHAAYWRPLVLPAAGTGMSMYVSIIGRLAPGASPASAAAELQGIETRGDPGRQEWNRGGQARVITLHERMFGGTRPLLRLLFGTSLLVLLIACANLASLLLARASVREREMALRTALGAGRGRLVRLLLAESLLLAFAGGGVALLVPAWGIPLLTRVGSLTSLSRLHVEMDATVVAVTALIALATGVLFGLAPAIAATRGSLRDTLAVAVGSGAPRHARLRQVLVSGQLAVALVLLIGATLLGRSLVRMTSVDPGFQPDHVLAATLSLPGARYPDAAATNGFYTALLERLRALPGVELAALADALPLQGFRYSRAVSLDHAPITQHGASQAVFNGVTEDYFATVGMTMAQGRAFNSADRKGSAPVVIVNESFAKQFAVAGGPVGHTLSMNGEMPVDPIIVGVVHDTRQMSQDVDVKPEVFLPAAQGDECPNPSCCAHRAIPPCSPRRSVARCSTSIPRSRSPASSRWRRTCPARPRPAARTRR